MLEKRKQEAYVSCGMVSYLHDLCDEAHVCDGAPLDGQSRQARLLAAQGQHIHGRIGVAIVGLPCTSFATFSFCPLIVCASRGGNYLA